MSDDRKDAFEQLGWVEPLYHVPVWFPKNDWAYAPCELEIPVPLVILGIQVTLSQWSDEARNAAILSIRRSDRKTSDFEVPLMCLWNDSFRLEHPIVFGASERGRIGITVATKRPPDEQLPFRITITRPPITREQRDRECP